MLDTLRKNRRGVLVSFLICFCGLLMVPFGVDLLNTQANQGVVIRVNQTEIGVREYYGRLDRWQAMFRQQLKDNYAQFAKMLNLEQRAVDDLIETSLLNEFLANVGLTVSTAQIESYIANHPFFNGNVTKESFRSFLQAQGLTESGLVAAMREQLMTEQLQSIFVDASTPVQVELESNYRAEKAKYSFRYYEVKPNDFFDAVKTPSAEDLQQLYDERKETFRKPRSFRIEALTFAPAQFASAVEISEDELKGAFEQSPGRFTEPKQVKLQRIVFDRDAGPSNLEALVGAEDQVFKQKAEQAKEKLQAGSDIAEVARTLGGKLQVDSDFVSYENLETEVRAAIGNLDIGAVSQPITLKESILVVRVSEKREKRERPFEEVRALLETELRQDYAPEYARAAAEDALRELEKARQAGPKALTDFSKEKNLSLIAPPEFISRSSSLPGIPAKVLVEAETLAVGMPQIIEAENSMFILEVMESKESYIPPLTEVEDVLLKMFKEREGRVLAKNEAEELLKQRSASGIKALDQLPGIKLDKLQTSPATERASLSLPFLSNPTTRQKILALNSEHSFLAEVVETGSSFFLVELAEVIEADLSKFAEERAAFEKKFQTDSSTRMLKALLQGLRLNADIWVDPNLVRKQ